MVTVYLKGGEKKAQRMGLTHELPYERTWLPICKWDNDYIFLYAGLLYNRPLHTFLPVRRQFCPSVPSSVLNTCSMVKFWTPGLVHIDVALTFSYILHLRFEDKKEIKLALDQGKRYKKKRKKTRCRPSKRVRFKKNEMKHANDLEKKRKETRSRPRCRPRNKQVLISYFILL